MKGIYFFIFLFFALHVVALAQYAPQAGLPGSTAIDASSSLFVGWASGCSVQRGFMDIANPAGGYASLGDSSDALGIPDRSVVSLGDSGIAVLTFANPIVNGPGPDFAVFENGFVNTDTPSLAFLELAFVEVSSDGVNYYRFPATSLTQDNVQLWNGRYIDASGLNNLAGKYVAMYGTPFDLDELAGQSGLDVNNITNVRVVDVVGSISGHSSYDGTGRIINDPYPTRFASCGFDLDAVGIIHEAHESVKQLSREVSVSVYPNPATDEIVISVKGNTGVTSAVLTNVMGSVLQQTSLNGGLSKIGMAQCPAGMYYLVLSDASGNRWTEKVLKR